MSTKFTGNLYGRFRSEMHLYQRNYVNLLRDLNSAKGDVLNNFQSQGDLIVSGDFNIGMMNPSNDESVIIELMKNDFYIPLITLPTREVLSGSS